MTRACAVLLLSLCSCGLVDGLKGPGDEPAGAATLNSLSWHGPVQIDQGVAASADAPWLAWGQGAAWASFYAYDSASNTASTWITRRPRGGSFAQPVQVPTPSGWNGAAYPQIAIGESGNPVLALTGWNLGSGGVVSDWSIWAARVDPSLTVLQGDLSRLDGTVTAGSADATLSQNNSVAVDDSGNALVLFSDSPGGLYVASQVPGGSWSSPASLSNNGLGGGLQIVAGSAGNALATVLGPTSDGSDDFPWYALPISVSSGGVTQAAGKLLFAGNNGVSAIAARGDQGMVVFTEGSADLYTYASSSGFWQSEQTIPDTKLSGYIEPSVSVNSKGEAVLIWRDYAAGGTDSYAGTLQASFWDGGSWSPQQQISNAGVNPHAWWAKVDLNERGEAVAAWADFEPTGTYTRIYAAVLETNSGAPVWSAPAAIDQDSPDAGLANQPQNVRYVGVSLDRDGGVAQVIYMQHEATTAAASRTWANWIEAP